MPIEEATARSAGPERQVVVDETVSRIESALMSLPEPLRLPLMLRVNEEMPYAEIAQVLDCTTSAVKMRICRARTALANALREEEQ
jgi:RNA polymerase sigma-70 factor (ECF subfamily)